MQPIVYSLEFRGTVSEQPGALRKQASAPGCALETQVGPAGLRGRFVWAPDDHEARLESALSFLESPTVEERGTITFARRHMVRTRGRGERSSCADPDLRHGAIIWVDEGGAGQF